jgi:hypothetical protein
MPATCWTGTEATKVIPTEAETPSDAVFLATHASIPVFQRDVVTNNQRLTETDEYALLAAALEQPADQPILPILGASGTGKSHLVRWLRAKLPDAESRRVIFVPKHRMSLRGIIDLILERTTSDRANELRQKVAKAVEGITDEHEAKLRLRGELAVLIETRSTQTDVSAEEQDLRMYLASSEGLPALLSDPVFRERLFDKTSPISRLVREKLAGKGAEDKDEAFGFMASDLAMSVNDVSRASTAASNVAAALSSDAQLREIAARMLNEHLNPAVSQVFGIGGDDLKDLLVEVRIELKRQELELLLLIEDFSIFQGIQGGLIDAITLIPTQGNDLCPMRVVMAVTTGYFVNQMPETVYTRVYKVFDLDGPAPKVYFDPPSVAARYMNAIRVGSRGLDESYHHDGQTPNACEQCPVNDACHRAFGSAGGYGLFPFNQNALNKAVKSKLIDDRLSVRDFLTRVLRPVLYNYHDEIEDGAFPNAEFDAAFRAGAVGTLDSVEDESRLSTPGDPELSKRRVILLRYWGGDGNAPHNLRSTIHQAFGIPQVPGLPGEADVEGGDREGNIPPYIAPAPGTPTPTAAQQKPQVPDLVRTVDSWRATGQLVQSKRNELRQIIHTAIIARLALEDGLGSGSMWTISGKQWDTTFDAKTSIDFSDRPVADSLITIDKDDDETVRVVRALAWVNSAEDWNAIENGEELQRLAEEKISEWAAQVDDAMFSHRDKFDNPELAVAANTLLAMSKALGLPAAFKSDALSRTRALFAPSPRGPDVTRPKLRQWQQRVCEDSQRLTRGLLQQRVLRLASFTQGSGRPLALDLPRVAKALSSKNTDDDIPSSTGLLEETASTVRARYDALPDVRDEASALVPDLGHLGGDLLEIIKKLSNIVTERANAGQLPSVIDRPGLSAAGKAIKTGDQKRVESVRGEIDNWDQLSIDSRVRLMTDDWDEPVARVRRWLDLATRAIEALEAKLGDGASSAAHVEYEHTRTAFVDTLRGVADILGSARESKETA